MYTYLLFGCKIYTCLKCITQFLNCSRHQCKVVAEGKTKNAKDIQTFRHPRHTNNNNKTNQIRTCQIYNS